MPNSEDNKPKNYREELHGDDREAAVYWYDEMDEYEQEESILTKEQLNLARWLGMDYGRMKIINARGQLPTPCRNLDSFLKRRIRWIESLTATPDMSKAPLNYKPMDYGELWRKELLEINKKMGIE